MTKIEQKVIIEDYLPDNVDAESIDDIIHTMYVYWLEKSMKTSAEINDMKFLLFIHPSILGYVYTHSKSFRYIVESNADRWKRVYKIEVTTLKDFAKNKIVMMEAF